MKMKLLFLVLILGTFVFLYYYPLNLQQLSGHDQKLVNSILTKIPQKLEHMKAEGENPNRLGISSFQSVLSWQERHFIRKLLRLQPSDLGAKTPPQKVEKIEFPCEELKNQPIMKDGKPLEIPAPLVSLATYTAYEKMMRAMEKDLGKRLYIESGHRSQGYHLYNFLKYLREHSYSLIETGKLNALPGYSEHNLWENHAVDLISAEGVNGEPRAEDYEILPEHQWMLKHAGEFGFTLSYPRGNPWGISFEPWHWKYSSEKNI